MPAAPCQIGLSLINPAARCRVISRARAHILQQLALLYTLPIDSAGAAWPTLCNYQITTNYPTCFDIQGLLTSNGWKLQKGRNFSIFSKHANPPPTEQWRRAADNKPRQLGAAHVPQQQIADFCGPMHVLAPTACLRRPAQRERTNTRPPEGAGKPHFSLRGCGSLPTSREEPRRAGE